MCVRGSEGGGSMLLDVAFEGGGLTSVVEGTEEEGVDVTGREDRGKGTEPTMLFSSFHPL